MPMREDKQFGSNKDSGKNTDYCCFCFQNGEFTSPGLSLEQMIARMVSMAPKFGFTKEQAEQMARKNLPGLKRWKK